MVLSQSAALHDVASRRAASRALVATSPSGPNAEAADYRRSVRRGAAHVEPPFRPSPCMPRAHARCAVPQRSRRRTRAAPPLVGDWPTCVAAHPAVLRPRRGP
jgi:hypothetical protein